MKRFYVVFLAVMLAIAPILAEARAGGSFSGSRSSASSSRSWSSPSRSTPSYSYGSMGSKGSNTYTPSQTYQPITRSTTPPPAPVTRPAPVTTAQPTVTQSVPSSVGSGPSHTGTFLAAGAGALTGSLIGNALSNHGTTVVNNGGYAGGVAPGGYAGTQVVDAGYSSGNMLGSFFSFLIVMIIIGLIIWIVYKLLHRNSYPKTVAEPHYSSMPAHDFNRYVSKPQMNTTIMSRNDKEQFKTILVNVQTAWSHRDKNKLRVLLTDEMYHYFSDILDENTAMGVINRIENVSSIECDILESWTEYANDAEFCTAIMRWHAHDFTTDLSGGIIDGGDVGYSRETWTFMRTSQDTWVVSAIQQMD